MNHRAALPSLFLSVAGLLLTTLPVLGGSISGHVHARGAVESSDRAEANYGSRRYKFLEKIDYSAFRDFVVYIDEIESPSPPDRPPPRATVTQRDGGFVPHVLPIVAGTIVDWPNADDVFHNVFCMSETTPFDLGLYKQGDDAKSVVFPKTGRMEVFCSIHTKMSCIVLVLPNPWFARVNAKGRYIIENVPPGTYKVRAWHERLPSKTAEVVVPNDGEAQSDFVLGPGAPVKN